VAPLARSPEYGAGSPCRTLAIPSLRRALCTLRRCISILSRRSCGFSFRGTAALRCALWPSRGRLGHTYPQNSVRWGTRIRLAGRGCGPDHRRRARADGTVRLPQRTAKPRGDDRPLPLQPIAGRGVHRNAVLRSSSARKHRPEQQGTVGWPRSFGPGGVGRVAQVLRTWGSR
jgi:hypothetical protein